MTTSYRTGPRTALASIAQSLAAASYLRRWLILGSAIGLIAGGGALLFYTLLITASHLFLGVLAGYQVPMPAGEGARQASAHAAREWALPLVAGAGGLASGLLVSWLAPEAEGHGTDAAIAAVSQNPRGIRFRAVAVKMLASAITIGSGGSGGREGPTAQISAGFGSLLCRVLNLSPSDARIAVSVGIGSGIGAIFKAPLGGAVLAAEIVYRDDLEVEALLPAIIASGVSYALFAGVEGFTPMFGYVSRYRFGNPAYLGWFALVGVVAGLIGLAYARGFYGIAGLFQHPPGWLRVRGWRRVPRWLRLPDRLCLPARQRTRALRAIRPAAGGLAVGLIALAVPEVLGTGYGWVQLALSRAGLLHLPLLLVLALPFARIAATGLSIGSGGSGGIFGPGMVIGAFTGAALWRLLEPLGHGVPHSPAPFVVVAMMACFGSICRAPLAIMLMVAEMTGSLAILAPAMIAVGIATLIVTRADATIYRSQLRSRADSPAHRLQAGLPLLSGVTVTEVMAAPRLVLDYRRRARDALGALRSGGLPGAPVSGHRRVFVGIVTTAGLAGLDHRASGRRLDRVVDVTAPSVRCGAALDLALEALGSGSAGWVPVLDSGQRVAGIVTPADVVRGYRGALAANAARMSRLAGNATAVDLRVSQSAAACGKPLARAGLPAGTIVVTVQRDSGLVFPDGSTTLLAGDIVSALVRPDAAAVLADLLTGAASARAPACHDEAACQDPTGAP